MTTKNTSLTRSKRITKTVRDRIFKLLAKKTFTHKEIAAKSKVSKSTVGRMSKEAR